MTLANIIHSIKYPIKELKYNEVIYYQFQPDLSSSLYLSNLFLYQSNVNEDLILALEIFYPNISHCYVYHIDDITSKIHYYMNHDTRFNPVKSNCIFIDKNNNISSNIVPLISIPQLIKYDLIILTEDTHLYNLFFNMENNQL